MTAPRPARPMRPTPLALALLLLTRLALGTVYSLVVPIWEAYDEDGHFAYVRYLAKYRRLLDPADPEARAVYEKFQPPLYYLMVAPFVAGFDLGDKQPRIERNPFWNHEYAGNNYALHPPRLEGAAAQIELAVRVGRLVGVVLSTLSVVFVYLVARKLWPNQPGPAWAATLLYAFWPQYLFIGSVINNDLAVTAFSAGVLWWSAQLATDGIRGRRVLALALCMGAALLSKVSALALLPVAFLGMVFGLAMALRRPGSVQTRPWLGVLAIGGVMVSTLALLWQLPYVRGHILRVEVITDFVTNVFRENTFNELREALLFAFRSFFALFGWGRRTLPSVALPVWLYIVWTLGFALGVVGLVIPTARHSAPDRRLLALLGALVVSLLGATMALVVVYQSADLAPGRYLLPALPGVCLLLVEGYRRLLPGRAQRYAWRALGLGAVALGWAIPLTTLIPVYAIPQPLRSGIDVPERYAFGDHIQLLGYQTYADVEPGQPATVELCWQATSPVPRNYTALLEVIGPNGEPYGRQTTYPGRGNFPTHFWTPGVPFCDRYAVPVDPAMPAPSQAWLHVSLVDTTYVNDLIIEGTRLAVINPDGHRSALDALVLPLRIKSARQPPPPDQPLNLRFGDALRLRGFSLAVTPETHSVQVTLQWEALNDLDRDYRIFVHLRDTPQSAYTQSDSVPRNGWYPTHLWRAGERVDDLHTLTLPDRNAPPLALYVGVIDISSELRVPVVDGSGQPITNDEVLLLENWVWPESEALPHAAELPAGAAP